MHEKSVELLNKAVADELAADPPVHVLPLPTATTRASTPWPGCSSGRPSRRCSTSRRSPSGSCSSRARWRWWPGEVEKIHDVGEMLEHGQGPGGGGDRQTTTASRTSARSNADSVSKKLFEDLVADEERHYDQFDSEPDIVERFGEKYLALQSFDGGGGEEPPA